MRKLSLHFHRKISLFQRFSHSRFSFAVSHSISEFKEFFLCKLEATNRIEKIETLAGRVTTIRKMSKNLIFIDISNCLLLKF